MLLEERVDLGDGGADVLGPVVEVEVRAALDQEQFLGLVGLGVGGLALDQGLGLVPAISSSGVGASISMVSSAENWIILS